MRTMPTCSPFGPTNLTSGTRMRSLMRVSTVMWPPQSCYPRRNRASGTCLPHPCPKDTPRTPRGPARIVTYGARRSDRSTPRVGCQHTPSTPESRQGFQDRTRPPRSGSGGSGLHLPPPPERRLVASDIVAGTAPNAACPRGRNARPCRDGRRYRRGALGGPGPAIGTVRIALPLAARGVRVDGVDLSPSMISKLRAKMWPATIRSPSGSTRAMSCCPRRGT